MTLFAMNIYWIKFNENFIKERKSFYAYSLAFMSFFSVLKISILIDIRIVIKECVEFEILLVFVSLL